MAEYEENEGSGEFYLLDRRKNTENTNRLNNDTEMNERTVSYTKILYNKEVQVEAYKVIIQKKTEASIVGISVLKVDDILFRKMKVGEQIQGIKKIGRNRIITH